MEMNHFDFYLRFAKPLVLNLAEPNERVLAAAWLQKLRNPESGDEQLRTDYLKLLLFVLQRRRLAGLFTGNPSQYEKLEEFPEKYKLQDVAKALIEAEEEDRRRKAAGAIGDFPPYTTEYSTDLLEYTAAQDIPNFGVHVYYALSKEPLPLWDHAEKGIFPRALSTGKIDVVSNVSLATSTATILSESSARRDRSRSRSRERPKSRSGTPKRRGRSPPAAPLGVPPLPDERIAPTWGTNLIQVSEPPEQVFSPKLSDISGRGFFDDTLSSYEEPPSGDLTGDLSFRGPPAQPYPSPDGVVPSPLPPPSPPSRGAIEDDMSAVRFSPGPRPKHPDDFTPDMERLLAMFAKEDAEQAPSAAAPQQKLVKKTTSKKTIKPTPKTRGTVAPAPKKPVPAPKGKPPVTKMSKTTLKKTSKPGAPATTVEEITVVTEQAGPSKAPPKKGKGIPVPKGKGIPMPKGKQAAAPKKKEKTPPKPKKTMVASGLEFDLDELAALGLKPEDLADIDLDNVDIEIEEISEQDGYDDVSGIGKHDEKIMQELNAFDQRIKELEEEFADDIAEFGDISATMPDASPYTPATSPRSPASRHRAPSSGAPSLPYRTPSPRRPYSARQPPPTSFEDTGDPSYRGPSPLPDSFEIRSPRRVSPYAPRSPIAIEDDLRALRFRTPPAMERPELEEIKRLERVLEKFESAARPQEGAAGGGVPPQVKKVQIKRVKKTPDKPTAPAMTPSKGAIKKTVTKKSSKTKPGEKIEVVESTTTVEPPPSRLRPPGSGLPVPGGQRPPGSGIPRPGSKIGRPKGSKLPAPGQAVTKKLAKTVVKPPASPRPKYPDMADLSAPSLPYLTPPRPGAQYDTDELAALGLRPEDLVDVEISVEEMKLEDVSDQDVEYEDDGEFKAINEQIDRELEEHDRRVAELEAEFAEDIAMFSDKLSPLKESPKARSPAARVSPKTPPRTAKDIARQQYASLLSPEAGPPPPRISPKSPPKTPKIRPGTAASKDIIEDANAALEKLYQKLQPERRQDMERTPPLFSKHPEIRKAAEGMEYRPEQFQLPADEPFTDALCHFMDVQEFSPYVDHRLPAQRRYSGVLGEDEPLFLEVEGLETVLSPTKPSPREEAQEVIKDLEESPAMAGIPITTPKRSPSPRRPGLETESPLHHASPEATEDYDRLSPGTKRRKILGPQAGLLPERQARDEFGFPKTPSGPAPSPRKSASPPKSVSPPAASEAAPGGQEITEYEEVEEVVSDKDIPFEEVEEEDVWEVESTSVLAPSPTASPPKKVPGRSAFAVPAFEYVEQEHISPIESDILNQAMYNLGEEEMPTDYELPKTPPSSPQEWDPFIADVFTAPFVHIKQRRKVARKPKFSPVKEYGDETPKRPVEIEGTPTPRSGSPLKRRRSRKKLTKRRIDFSQPEPEVEDQRTQAGAPWAQIYPDDLFGSLGPTDYPSPINEWDQAPEFQLPSPMKPTGAEMYFDSPQQEQSELEYYTAHSPLSFEELSGGEPEGLYAQAIQDDTPEATEEFLIEEELIVEESPDGPTPPPRKKTPSPKIPTPPAISPYRSPKRRTPTPPPSEVQKIQQLAQRQYDALWSSPKQPSPKTPSPRKPGRASKSPKSIWDEEYAEVLEAETIDEMPPLESPTTPLNAVRAMKAMIEDIKRRPGATPKSGEALGARYSPNWPVVEPSESAVEPSRAVVEEQERTPKRQVQRDQAGRVRHAMQPRRLAFDMPETSPLSPKRVSSPHGRAGPPTPPAPVSGGGLAGWVSPPAMPQAPRVPPLGQTPYGRQLFQSTPPDMYQGEEDEEEEPYETVEESVISITSEISQMEASPEQYFRTPRDDSVPSPFIGYTPSYNTSSFVSPDLLDQLEAHDYTSGFMRDDRPYQRGGLVRGGDRSVVCLGRRLQPPPLEMVEEEYLEITRGAKPTSAEGADARYSPNWPVLGDSESFPPPSNVAAEEPWRTPKREVQRDQRGKKRPTMKARRLGFDVPETSPLSPKRVSPPQKRVSPRPSPKRVSPKLPSPPAPQVSGGGIAGWVSPPAQKSPGAAALPWTPHGQFECSPPELREEEEEEQEAPYEIIEEESMISIISGSPGMEASPETYFDVPSPFIGYTPPTKPKQEFRKREGTPDKSYYTPKIQAATETSPLPVYTPPKPQTPKATDYSQLIKRRRQVLSPKKPSPQRQPSPRRPPTPPPLPVREPLAWKSPPKPKRTAITPPVSYEAVEMYKGIPSPEEYEEPEDDEFAPYEIVEEESVMSITSVSPQLDEYADTYDDYSLPSPFLAYTPPMGYTPPLDTRRPQPRPPVMEEEYIEVITRPGGTPHSAEKFEKYTPDWPSYRPDQTLHPPSHTVVEERERTPKKQIQRDETGRKKPTMKARRLQFDLPESSPSPKKASPKSSQPSTSREPSPQVLKHTKITRKKSPSQIPPSESVETIEVQETVYGDFDEAQFDVALPFGGRTSPVAALGESPIRADLDKSFMEEDMQDFRWLDRR